MGQHVRQQIREAAVALLTGLPSTGDRVFTGDPYAKSPEDGPFLIVAAPADERDDEWSDIGQIGGRRLALVVIGDAEARDIEDVLDAIACEVEAAIEGQTFGGLAKNTVFLRVAKDFEDGTSKRAGEVRIEFAVTYRVRTGVPDVAVG